MKALKIGVPLVLTIGLLLIAAGPIGPIPGVFIGGTSTDAPDAWGEIADVDEIRLAVPGAIPRVVIIWVIEVDGELHVVGAGESGWVQRIVDGAPVRMRVGDLTYALRATPVAAGKRRVLEAYVGKYEADYPDIIADFPPIDEAEEFAAVFRLERAS